MRLQGAYETLELIQQQIKRTAFSVSDSAGGEAGIAPILNTPAVAAAGVQVLRRFPPNLKEVVGSAFFPRPLKSTRLTEVTEVAEAHFYQPQPPSGAWLPRVTNCNLAVEVKWEDE